MLSLVLGELKLFSFSTFSPVEPPPDYPPLWLEVYSASPECRGLEVTLVWKARIQVRYSPPPEYIPEVGSPDVLWLLVSVFELRGPLAGLAAALALLAPRGLVRAGPPGRGGGVLPVSVRRRVPTSLVEVAPATCPGLVVPRLGG